MINNPPLTLPSSFLQAKRKPGERRMATKIIFVMTQCHWTATYSVDYMNDRNAMD